MLDRDGYRPNVGIILINHRNEVFWGKRIREHSWQFPQGGIKRGETPEQAMYRELNEEVGLQPEHVRIVGRTREWLRYEVPDHWVRREWRGHYRGQKQIWFLLRMVGRDTDVDLRASSHPEFDAWRWNDYWIPLESVIEFKRGVYQMALQELARFIAAARPDGGRFSPPARWESLRGGGTPSLRDRDRERGRRRAESPPAAPRGGDEHAPGDGRPGDDLPPDAVRVRVALPPGGPRRRDDLPPGGVRVFDDLPPGAERVRDVDSTLARPASDRRPHDGPHDSRRQGRLPGDDPMAEDGVPPRRTGPDPDAGSR